MNMLIRNVPDELHKAFKLQCVSDSISMEKALIRLIEKATKEPGLLRK